MAITHSAATRNTFCSDVNTALTAGTTNPAPRCVLKEGSTVICTIDLDATSPFNAPSGGSMTINTTNTLQGTVTAAPTTAIDNFDFVDKDGTVVFSGNDVRTTSGGDLQISNLTPAVNDTITITGGSYTAAP